MQVAKALGVKVGTITTWEKNRGEPCGERLAGIIRFLGYDPRAGLPALRRHSVGPRHRPQACAGLYKGLAALPFGASVPADVTCSYLHCVII